MTIRSVVPERKEFFNPDYELPPSKESNDDVSALLAFAVGAETVTLPLPNSGSKKLSASDPQLQIYKRRIK